MADLYAPTQGHTVVVVGGLLGSRPFAVETAARLGMRRIAAIDTALEDDLSGQAWQRIVPWTASKTRDSYERAADQLAQALRDEQVTGVVTFSDYCAGLAAMLAERLGVARVAAETLWTCRTKLGIYSLLQRSGSPYPPRVRVITPDSDLEACAHDVGLPAILRISHSASAVGVRLVSSVDEIREQAARLRAVPDAPENVLVSSFESEILLVEYLSGSEHDVDIVIAGGEPQFCFVTDNGPTDLPYFRETTHVFPSRLPRAQQDALKQAALRCLRDLGLRDGVYNVELRLTAGGPRLIEINLRMGGFYIREFALKLFGYDLSEAALRIACGLPPIAAASQPVGYLAGFIAFPSDHVDFQALPKDGVHLDCGDSPVTEYEQPMHFISLPGDSADAAIERAIATAPSLLGPARGAQVQAHLRAILHNHTP